MSWEVDWSNSNNTKTKIWARDTNNHMLHCREWGLVNIYVLKRAGVNTPVYRKDSWEVDWDKRNHKLVWGRNPLSKMPSARDWHWIDHHALDRTGTNWKPANGHTGKTINAGGYVVLTKMGMTEDDIRLAETHDLFRGSRKLNVAEHRLVALKKYGSLPVGSVVRHINGIKTDNRPENLVLGTTQENTMDHNRARIMAMFWREKYETLLAEIGVRNG